MKRGALIVTLGAPFAVYMLACAAEPSPIGVDLRNRLGLLGRGSKECLMQNRAMLSWDYDPDIAQEMDRWWIITTQGQMAGMYAPDNGRDVGGWWHYDEGCATGEGGGGGAPPPPCNPRTDLLCERAMASEERQILADALAAYVKDTMQIADPALRTRCHQMRHMLNGLMLNYNNFKTAFGGQIPPTNKEWHYAVWDPATDITHVEPWLLWDAESSEKAKWELAASALHEMGHRLGHDHPDNVVEVQNGFFYKGIQLFYPGPTVYQYFEDLLPNANGCMLPYPSAP